MSIFMFGLGPFSSIEGGSPFLKGVISSTSNLGGKLPDNLVLNGDVVDEVSISGEMMHASNIKGIITENELIGEVQ